MAVSREMRHTSLLVFTAIKFVKVGPGIRLMPPPVALDVFNIE